MQRTGAAGIVSLIRTLLGARLWPLIAIAFADTALR